MTDPIREALHKGRAEAVLGGGSIEEAREQWSAALVALDELEAELAAEKEGHRLQMERADTNLEQGLEAWNKQREAEQRFTSLHGEWLRLIAAHEESETRLLELEAVCRMILDERLLPPRTHDALRDLLAVAPGRPLGEGAVRAVTEHGETLGRLADED